MAPLLFDLDGTIIDCRARHYTLYARIIGEQGGTPLAGGEYWRRRRAGKSTMDVLSATPEVDVERFTRAWFGRIESPAALALDAPFDGAVRILESVRAEHQVILVTLRRDRRALLHQLDSLRLTSLFEEIISCGPRPESRKALLPGCSALASGGYVIGDTEADLELGSGTGRRTVCVSNGVRSGRFLAARGARTVISSLRELPEVITAAERSGGPGDVADVEHRVASRYLHTRAGL